jgi:hypothetical protein
LPPATGIVDQAAGGFAVQPHQLQPTRFYRRSARDLNDIQQLQDDEDQSNNDQRMNPTTGLREPWTNIPTEKAEQPQNYQNHDYSPHKISPFE